MQKPEGGINARGAVAEVWQGGSQVGTLWDWRLSGFDGRWSAEAPQQSFAPGFSGGECELRFLLTASTGDMFHIRGAGHVSGYLAGERCRRLVEIRGSRLWTVTASLASIS